MKVTISAFEKYPAYSIRKAEAYDTDKDDFVVDMADEEAKHFIKVYDDWRKTEQELARIYSELEDKKYK